MHFNASWQFHALTISAHSNSEELMRAWQHSFSSLSESSAETDLSITLNIVPHVPNAPAGEPDYAQGELLQYYVAGDRVTVHFPRYGQLYLDLSSGTTRGKLVEAALTTYGVLEDMVAISLSPHLRRHGYFLIHAFAAMLNGKALLLVGGIGAGKTTTGMSLLNAGWRLISNDSPIIAADGVVLSYPGVLAGYPETFARFERTAHLADAEPTQSGRQKLLISAETVFPNVWTSTAPIGAIIFPQIEARESHALSELGQPESLRRLLPHAVEQWDKQMIPKHFSVLRQLASAAPAYVLHLGPDVLAIPDVLQSVMSDV